MSDPIGAVVTLLAADAGVAGIAGADVFGAELPAAAVARMPASMVVVQASGGVSLTAGTYAEHDTQRVDLTCYAKTPRLAEQLLKVAARALRAARRVKVGNTLLHWADSAGGFTVSRERDGAWPMAFQSFQIFHSLEEV